MLSQEPVETLLPLEDMPAEAFTIVKRFDDPRRYEVAVLIDPDLSSLTVIATGALARELHNAYTNAHPDALHVDYQDGITRWLVAVEGRKVTDQDPFTVALRCSIIEAQALTLAEQNSG